MPHAALRNATLVAVLALGLGVAAAVAPPAQAAAAADKDPVVAVVEGEEIRRSDLEMMKERMGRQIPQLATMPLEAVYGGLLERAIDQKLLAKAGREAGLADDPEVRQQLKEVENELIQRAYLSRAVEKRITEDDLKTLYQQFLKENPSEDEIKARHILLETEQEAKDVIARLDKGADFAELAKEKSTGPSGPRGGDLGWFTQGTMVPEFSEAAFGLKKGEITKTPVKTQFGWHVIKVEDRRKSAPPSFEEAKEDLRAQAAQKAVTDVLADLRKDAEVETFDLDGKPAAQ